MPKPKKPRNDLLDRLQYIGLRLVAMFLHCFPVNANMRTARVLGSIVFRIDKKHRNRALANLRRSFPELKESQLQVIAEKSVQHLLMFCIDMLFTTRLVRLDTWRNYVELKDFRRTLELLLQRERGLILLTGHYGNWEILGYVLATLGFGTLSVARPLDNPYVNNYVLGVRERRGQKIIGKRGATTEITSALTQFQTVGFIADQNAGSKGVFVDFFGRKASTYKSIGLLAMEYQVPVVIGYARRLGDEFRFEVAAQDIIQPDDWRDEQDPLRYITQRYTRAIEDFVRQEPSQYLWVHRRWKSRPKGEIPEPQD